MKKKMDYRKEFSVMTNSQVFLEKQKIAIEQFGEMFEDEVFFALELTLNEDLKKVINKEYQNQNRIRRC